MSEYENRSLMHVFGSVQKECIAQAPWQRQKWR
jgi:hypothetical protein